MRCPLFLAFSGLLLGAPLVSRAQTAPAPATPRFYVGLGVYSSYYQKLGNRSPEGFSTPFRVPVQLTVGYQWTPRLTVQASAAYSGNSRDLIVLNYNNPASPTGYSQSKGQFTARTVSVSALARYALTCPVSRLQVDALGGLGLEYSGSNSSATTAYSQSGPVAETFQNSYSTNILLATLGAGARYRLSPHFELAYDFTVNRALRSDSRAYLDRSLTTSHALGLRYRFGPR